MNEGSIGEEHKNYQQNRNNAHSFWDKYLGGQLQKTEVASINKK